MINHILASSTFALNNKNIYEINNDHMKNAILYLMLCLADAIHNFMRVKIIQIWQNGGQLFPNLADWCHILSLTR